MAARVARVARVANLTTAHSVMRAELLLTAIWTARSKIAQSVMCAVWLGTMIIAAVTCFQSRVILAFDE